MNLLKEILNAEQLDAMFEGTFSLDNTELESILFHSGPNMSLNFNQLNFPKTVPRKWVIKKFNALSFSLELINIKSICVNLWEPLIKCSPYIIKEDNLFKLEIKKDDKVIISCSASFLELKDISGYIDTRNLY